MTCGKTRHAPPGCLRYINRREEPGRQSYLNQPGGSGDKHDLDHWESEGDQTHYPPGDKKIIVSRRDLSLIRGIASVRGFPCMGYNSALGDGESMREWDTGSGCP